MAKCDTNIPVISVKLNGGGSSSGTSTGVNPVGNGGGTGVGTGIDQLVVTANDT